MTKAVLTEFGLLDFFEHFPELIRLIINPRWLNLEDWVNLLLTTKKLWNKADQLNELIDLLPLSRSNYYSEKIRGSPFIKVAAPAKFTLIIDGPFRHSRHYFIVEPGIDCGKLGGDHFKLETEFLENESRNHRP